MEKTDYLGLNGTQLQILVAIHRAGSLSLAAKTLDMNQSTLSYWLAQLRDRLGDPLFVRVGQGMQPTDRMERIAVLAVNILQQMQTMAEPTGYDPAQDTGRFRIACSAIERELLVHPLIKRAAREAPQLTFDIVALGSGFQVADQLREGALDLALYPAILTDTEDLFQRGLFPTHDVVYFDKDHPLPSGDLEAYTARPHARVALGPDAEFVIDRKMAQAGRTRTIALQAFDFDVLAQMIVGTPMIATLPSHMHRCRFCNLSWVEAPWPNDPLDIVAYWHVRNQHSNRHQYWRQSLSDIAAEIMTQNIQG